MHLQQRKCKKVSYVTVIYTTDTKINSGIKRYQDIIGIFDSSRRDSLVFTISVPSDSIQRKNYIYQRIICHDTSFNNKKLYILFRHTVGV